MKQRPLKLGENLKFVQFSEEIWVVACQSEEEAEGIMN